MGSDCSLIKKELVEEFKLIPTLLDNPVTLTGFTTGSSTEVSHTVTATITVDRVSLFIRFYVIDSLCGCSILIGRTFAEILNIMYTRVGNFPDNN